MKGENSELYNRESISEGKMEILGAKRKKYITENVFSLYGNSYEFIYLFIMLL